jgi:hypothetical protein
MADAPDVYRKPIEGMGDPPMLRYGYAAKKFWFSFMNLTLLSAWLCSAVWVIVGNDEPNTLPVTPVVDGNATAAASLSVATAESFWNAVSEPVWDIIGMPQDIGTSDALAGSTIRASNAPTMTALTNILFTILPSSIIVGY